MLLSVIWKHDILLNLKFGIPLFPFLFHQHIHQYILNKTQATKKDEYISYSNMKYHSSTESPSTTDWTYTTTFWLFPRWSYPPSIQMFLSQLTPPQSLSWSTLSTSYPSWFCQHVSSWLTWCAWGWGYYLLWQWLERALLNCF